MMNYSGNLWISTSAISSHSPGSTVGGEHKGPGYGLEPICDATAK
jgi:hypothetical protein